MLKAPPAVAPATWTGAYAGASLGGRWSDADWTTTGIAGPLFQSASPDPSTAFPSFNRATPRAGIFYGYNWQVGSSWVVGLESDLAWGNSTQTITGIPGTYGTSFGGIAASAADSTQVKEGWDASSRVRAGYLVMPNVLAYATAGVATQNISATATCSGAGPWCATNRFQSDSWTRVGWTVGGGVEAKLWGNWLGRVEYRYADYGTISNTVFANTADSVSYDLRLRTQTALVGLAYRFDRSMFESLAGSVDIPTAAPAAIYKAHPMPVASWTGAYAGVSAGGRWSDTGWTTTGVNDGEGAFTGGLNGTTQPDPSSAAASFDSSTFRLGGLAGYLWQVSPHWVVGTEADIAWGNNSRTVGGILGTFGPAIGNPMGPADSTTVKEGWDSSYLTRVGYLVTPDVLLYGTGGTSLLRVTASAACTAGTGWCVFNHAESDSWIKLGWTIGAGLEAALGNNWRARAEYRYADYGTITQTFFANSVDSVTADIKVKTQTALVGLSYALGGP
ncbi:MAG: outer membrane beta-barrel protein [Xanthobacteraceae bacterium]